MITPLGLETPVFPQSVQAPPGSSPGGVLRLQEIDKTL